MAPGLRRVSEGTPSGEYDHPAWLAARAAIRQLRQDLNAEEAGKHASAAIHYASVFHTKWLWQRVGNPKWGNC